MIKNSYLLINIILIVTVSCIGYSCVSTQKARAYKVASSEVKSISAQSLDSLDKADSIRAVKFANGIFDTMSNEMLDHYIDSMKKVSMNHLRDDSILTKTKLTHQTKEFITEKAYRLVQEAKTQLDNVKLVNELLSTNTFIQLSMSSLFEPGQYMLDGENRQTAIEAFRPVVNDLLKFAEKFPGKKLAATIVVIGYADASPIEPASELEMTLMAKINKTPTNQELNKELSRLRAGSASIVIRQIFINEKNTSDKFRQLSMEMLPQGRGEDFPNPSITDYKTDDERRRVVNVFWTLLPLF
jgi:hypothetical protein